MRNKKFSSASFVKSLSTAVAAALIVASPGPLAVRAFAAGIVGKAAPTANVAIPSGNFSLPSLNPAASLNGSVALTAPNLGLGALPALTGPAFNTGAPAAAANISVSPAGTAVAAPTNFSAAPSAARAAVETAVSPVLRTPAPARAEAAPANRRPAALRRSLSEGAAEIAQAKSPSAKNVALATFFTGSRRAAVVDAAAPEGSVLGALTPHASRTPAPLQRAPEAYRAVNGADKVPGVSVSRAKAPAPGAARVSPLRAAANALFGRTPARVNAADSKDAPKKEAANEDDDFTPEQKKGIMGMFLARPFGMLGFSLSAMAYPLMLIDAVGKSQMYDLFSLGGIISIGMNLVVGKLGDHMPLKKYIVYNNLLRAGLALANAVLYSMGFLNFGSLLLLTVLNSFQFSSLFITDQAMTAEIVGANRGKIRSTEALIRTASILVNIGSGLFLGSIIVDTLGFVWTFGIVAAVTAVPAFILWKMLPEIAYKPGKKPLGEIIREFPAMIRAFFSRIFDGKAGAVEPAADDGKAARGYLINAAILGASIAGYAFVYATPFWIIVAMSYILIKSDIFRNVIMKHGLLKMALLLVMVTAFVEVPMRNAVLGALSEEVAGEMGTASFYGTLIASFYMGQLVTGTGLLSGSLDVEIKKIGPWKLKNPVSFNLKKTMRWVGALVLSAWAIVYVLPGGWLAGAAASIPALGVKAGLAVPLVGMLVGAMTSLWGYARKDAGKRLGATLVAAGAALFAGSLLLPVLPGLLASLPAWGVTALGSVIAAAALTKFYHVVHDYTPNVTERGWMRLEALALLAVGIPPLLFWGNFPVLFASLFLFGMLHNPTNRTISATYSQQAKAHADGNYQYLSGIKGSFFTMATSTAYALYGLAKILPEKLWGDPNAFPFTWYVVAGLYAVIAAIFLIGSRVIPFGKAGEKKEEKK